MNKQLSLQKNSDIVNQYSKAIIKAVLNKIAKRNDQEIGIFDRDFDELEIPGIKYLTTEKMVVQDYGWLMYENIADILKNYGKTFQGILTARTNKRNFDRSTFVNCPSTIKGQKLLTIFIHLEDNYKENFLVINQKGKIVKSRFGSMYSHNWDKDSAEALALINHSIRDYEMEEA